MIVWEMFLGAGSRGEQGDGSGKGGGGCVQGGDERKEGGSKTPPPWIFCYDWLIDD